jgi:mono/diheme cytochrome c family protein
MPGAQTSDAPAARTTLTGVFTAAQAMRGRDTYAFSCQGCHTVASHTGHAFMGAWNGKSLAELFQYIRYSMPKSEPGTLSAGEYAQVTAYILQLNGMPDGSLELPADSAALSVIRIARREP